MRPIAVALLAVLATAPAGAEETRALVGQPVLALATHPEVTLTLRQSTGGRQGAVARLARAPGPPLRLTPGGDYVYGWGCLAATGCGADGFFLAHDTVHAQIFVVLFEGGQPLLWVPPRASPWPAALAAPLREFSAEIAGRMNFAPPRAAP
jgi:hypothetical protein